MQAKTVERDDSKEEGYSVHQRSTRRWHWELHVRVAVWELCGPEDYRTVGHRWGKTFIADSSVYASVWHNQTRAVGLNSCNILCKNASMQTHLMEALSLSANWFPRFVPLGLWAGRCNETSGCCTCKREKKSSLMLICGPFAKVLESIVLMLLLPSWRIHTSALFCDDCWNIWAYTDDLPLILNTHTHKDKDLK